MLVYGTASRGFRAFSRFSFTYALVVLAPPLNHTDNSPVTTPPPIKPRTHSFDDRPRSSTGAISRRPPPRDRRTQRTRRPGGCHHTKVRSGRYDVVHERRLCRAASSGSAHHGHARRAHPRAR